MVNYFEEIKKKNLFVSNHLDDINEKRIFLRIDTNSAVVHGKLDMDSYKLFAHAKKIKEYVDAGALPVIATHQGRKGDEDFVPNLGPLAKKMEQISGVKINYIDEIVGERVAEKINKLKLGEALLIKNMRDHPHETELESIDDMINSPITKFYKDQVDMFINDGLSVCHRCQLSVVALSQIMPFYFGLLLEPELKIIEDLIVDLEDGKEVTFFVGGKKFEKIKPRITRSA